MARASCARCTARRSTAVLNLSIFFLTFAVLRRCLVGIAGLHHLDVTPIADPAIRTVPAYLLQATGREGLLEASYRLARFKIDIALSCRV